MLGCTGCQLGLGLDVTVNRDGGGTLALAVTADAQLQERAAQAQAEPLDALVARSQDLRSGGWSIRDSTDEGGTRTVTLSVPFSDPAHFNKLADELATALAADEVELLRDLELVMTDEALTLRGTAGAEPTRAVRDYGLRPARVVRVLAREDALAYRITAQMPGEVVTTNGETADDRRVSWTVAPGETVEFVVEARRPGFPLLPVIVGGSVGGLLAGGALWIVVRWRQPAARSARMRSFSART